MPLIKTRRSLSPESRAYTMSILARLLLDHEIVRDCTIAMKIEDIMSAIVASMDEEVYHEEVSNMPRA